MNDKKPGEATEDGIFVDMSLQRKPVDDIFPGAHRQIAQVIGVCASPPFGCGNKVTGFRDEISAREYKITSLCQQCKDKLYEESDEDMSMFESFCDPEAKGSGGGEA